MKKLAFALTTVAGALFCSSFLALAKGAAALTKEPGSGLTPQAPPLPWAQIGAKAGADYHGDGLSVTLAGHGARLGCAFQRLEGEATTEGLWLVSTVTNAPSDRFSVVAASVGRVAHAHNSEGPPGFGLCQSSGAFQPPACFQERQRTAAVQDTLALPCSGAVQVADKLVRFLRPGLIEEYSVSVDGVRQDLVLTQRPAGTGELQVQLAVSGARVVSGSARPSRASAGASPEDVAVLVLNESGRRIAYSRLRATDATGRELPARIEVASHSAFGTPHSALESLRTPNCASALAVRVADAGAVYPVRIDPTFSDANWISVDTSGFGDVCAACTDSVCVYALAMSGSDLYAGGHFTAVGGSCIAKWNGSSWSDLAGGMGGSYFPGLPDTSVFALAVSGSDLYAGGDFTTAGGIAANYIAKWNGSSWSPLGSGVDLYVYALAVSGNDLYAGGCFQTAGGKVVNCIAKWNGSSWSALGSGMAGATYRSVNALAVSGSDLYAGGNFTTAGGSAANNIAKWNGSSWSALGSGLLGSFSDSHPPVYALAVLGSDLYAGGEFVTAGGSAAYKVAKWDGSSWSALGSGIGSIPLYAFENVYALAVSGSNLYAGGAFDTAGGSVANCIAKWDGSSWSALGSGMNGAVRALAVSGSDLYAGGGFTNAGGKFSAYVARAYLDLPTLSIFRSGSDVTLSWPVSFGRFALQQNSDAAKPSSWCPANYPLTTNGATQSATVPLTPTNQVFRLIGN